MAPSRIAAAPPRQRWQLLSAAASLAAVAMVAWVAFGPQEGAPQTAKLAPPQEQVQVPSGAAQVAPPDTANDYLYAHQGYSPRNSLQGVAPYVRMVSGEAGAQKK
jgi:hypothetical protein